MTSGPTKKRSSSRVRGAASPGPPGTTVRDVAALEEAVDDDRLDVAPTVRCDVPSGFLGTAPEVPAPPSADARFELVRVLARGGMGTIRQAFDHHLLRTVALKVLEPTRDAPADEVVRFVEEAQITAQLDHPNIVPVHDLGRRADEHGRPFFAMKLVTGQTLGDVFRRMRANRLDSVQLEQALEIFMKVCDAVSFAHSRGVVHRDLKPDNVMVGSHGQVYLMDWGVALLKGTSRPSDATARVVLERDPKLGNVEETGTIVGTAAYMAPEQAQGETASTDERTDVFGLGAILYELLTGLPPNPGRSYDETLESAQRGERAPPEERAAWPDVPPGLCEITRRALSTRPEDRHPTVDALKSDVKDFVRGGGWFSTRHFQPGSVIVKEGEPSDAAYVIVSGTCEAYRGRGRDRVSLRRMGPGDVFGETGVFSARPRTASVVAIDLVVAKVVTKESLQQELERNAWMAAFVRTLAERFLEAEEALRTERKRREP